MRLLCVLMIMMCMRKEKSGIVYPLSKNHDTRKTPCISPPPLPSTPLVSPSVK